jgi:hypothetical protein
MLRNLQSCFRLLLLIAICVLPQHVFANAIYPFYISNQNPFIQIFGLPRSEPAYLLANNQFEQITTLDIVNNTVKGSNSHEELVLDGESYRLNFAFKYTFDDTEYTLQLPLVRHTSGRFDNFIRSWHQFFGLSNDEQKQFPANQLNYYYARNGNKIVDITKGVSGIGDLQIGLARYFEGRRTVVRASLKLPTGDVDKLMGSGAPDVSFTVSSQDANLLSQYHIGLYGQLGLLWLGASDLFPAIQRHTVALGTAGFSWHYWKVVVLRSQLDLHSPFYKSSIVDIGGSSVQLTVGGSLVFSRRHRMDIGVTENLFSDATPDIGLNLTFRSLF